MDSFERLSRDEQRDAAMKTAKKKDMKKEAAKKRKKDITEEKVFDAVEYQRPQDEQEDYLDAFEYLPFGDTGEEDGDEDDFFDAVEYL